MNRIVVPVAVYSAILLAFYFCIFPAFCTKKLDAIPHRVTVLLSGNDVPHLESSAAKAYANGDTLAGDALMSVANTKLYYFYPGK